MDEKIMGLDDILELLIEQGIPLDKDILYKAYFNSLTGDAKKAAELEYGNDIIKKQIDEFLARKQLQTTNIEADIREFFDERTITDKNGNEKTISTFNPKKMGDFIKSKVNFKTLMGSDEIYYYKNGLYIPHGKELIKSFCVQLLGDTFKSRHMNEVVTYIQSSTYVEPNIINNEWMNLENGLLNPLTREFREHTPDIFSITRIPILYNPKAECPIWIKTLSEKIDDITYKTVQEMFGYCFLPGQKYEKAFLLYGPKRTFKSTTLNTLEKLIGRENLVAFALQQINDDSFAAAYLYGKEANICADITARALRDTGRFLTITGGDPITAGKKNKDHITFYPSTKLIFSCNVIPATTNKNPAFYRRWIILKFDRQTPIEQVDYNFKNRLKEELPGIMNWALEGLKRLEEQGNFSYALSEDDIRDLYERSSNTIQSFIYNSIDTENDLGTLTKREVYKKYLEYCKENELQPENAIYFGRMFIALTGCGTGRKGVGEESIPAYKGVNWKIEEEKDKNKLTGYGQKSETDDVDNYTI